MNISIDVATLIVSAATLAIETVALIFAVRSASRNR